MKEKYILALKTAFPYTIPIFAGSMEFVAVNLLLGIQSTTSISNDIDD